MVMAVILLCAYLLDRIIGDPRWITHPVVYMGRVITRLEQAIRRRFTRPASLKWAGLLFPLFLVGGSYLIVWLLLKGLAMLHPWLAWAAEVWLISTTIATKGLAEAGMNIYAKLQVGDLPAARSELAMVVGRDTEQLDEPEIVRGAVETVAENIVDAILSPLFYAAIGGAPLAMAYRAANTLDSMVGYKNERYEHLGWASARFDDLANYIPARIGALLIVAASLLRRLQWRQSWRVIRRDARLHPSPNSGFSEAGVAGALGVQLGGLNTYKGVPSDRARLGDPNRPLQADDILHTVKLMYLVSILFVCLCAGVLFVLR
ncbi:adenosylcobinamide-phosphate synthase CbiB [Brevibacillus sp. B_LB10_24]|uniref:adenosylcobinamide-phosphate synthase CbiB n=1 Tax=Brevibacillus sp. B_LB10_24 TaxID=3380645 RepID=UPI0038BA36E3